MFKFKKYTNIKPSKLINKFANYSTQPDVVIPYILKSTEGMLFYKISRLSKKSNTPSKSIKFGNTKIPITDALTRNSLQVKYSDTDYTETESHIDGTITITGIDLTDATYNPTPHSESYTMNYNNTIGLMTKHELHINETILKDISNDLYKTTIWKKKEGDTSYCLVKHDKSIPKFADTIDGVLVKEPETYLPEFTVSIAIIAFVATVGFVESYENLRDKRFSR